MGSNLYERDRISPILHFFTERLRSTPYGISHCITSFDNFLGLGLFSRCDRLPISSQRKNGEPFLEDS
ncbi:hypothetical protein [Cylindrospermopsis curvispora]|uniref:Uncharacterized protein n=1 Tax=Cylindrospermopsis curvispora GIHE-G1 TaxID=2666332 RepID=A0A7H0F5U2_9CYAN|nr:hypothetical protein [Cylindrospermopsis curvispora]QNP31408.1 hypothetical protein IAR63_17595 [Cylindrospermopsis curvispora GIHE-G1]